jgi:hypothetical protein
MLDSICFKENHDNECPQSQDEAPRRMPIFQLWFLQNKDNMINLAIKNSAIDKA